MWTALEARQVNKLNSEYEWTKVVNPYECKGRFVWGQAPRGQVRHLLFPRW